MSTEATYIDETAWVADHSKIGQGTVIWQRVRIGREVSVGDNSRIGSDTIIDGKARIGSRVKIQNQALIFGATIADMAFVGPRAMFVEDASPRSVDEKGRTKEHGDWNPNPASVGIGATIGAAAVVLPGVKIGAWSMVTAAAVCASDFPSNSLIAGNPARIVGRVCACAQRLDNDLACSCGRIYAMNDVGGLICLEDPVTGL